jgi:hypothetical protein
MRGRAIAAHDIGLHLEAVGDRGDIPQVRGDAIFLLDGQTVELIDGAWRAVDADIVFLGSDLDRSPRRHHILDGQGIENIAGRKMARLHCGLIEIDRDLALLAAIGGRHNRTRNGNELWMDEVLGVVIQRLLAEPFAGDAQPHDRHAGGAIADNFWWEDAGRQLAKLILRCRRRFCRGPSDVGARLQVDPDHDESVVGSGLDMIHVIDEVAEILLERSRQPAFELLGIESCILPGQRDDRDIDSRKHIHRRAHDDHRA